MSESDQTPQRALFAISVAADLASMQIQNLRVYERRGLLSPARTPGGSRLYSESDIARLRRIGELLADGLNLAGIARVLVLEDELRRLRASNSRLRASARA
ncbi:MAG: MerR family transcriptional regulator [Nocardioides sp.]|jgi:MerR family transcriptional regulator/heat shock protein HspR